MYISQRRLNAPMSSESRDLVYVPSGACQICQPEVPQRVSGEGIYSRFFRELFHRFRPHPVGQWSAPISAGSRQKQCSAPAAQTAPLLQVFLIEAARVNRVRYDPLQTVLCCLCANSHCAMRRIDVTHLNRAEFLTTKSCVIAQRKHQPHPRTLPLNHGQDSLPVLLARNPRQRMKSLDQTALTQPKRLAWNVATSPNGILFAQSFFAKEIVEEANDRQALLQSRIRKQGPYVNRDHVSANGTRPRAQAADVVSNDFSAGLCGICP